MDFQLVNRGLNFTMKKRKWVLILAAFGVTGYGVFRAYNSPSVVRKRNKFLKLLSALVSVTESVSDSAETLGILSRDLREFLQSDSDEIPNSLKQISKIAMSNEFFDSVVRVSVSLTTGVLKGYQVESSKNNNTGSVSSSGFSDRFMDKLFSNSGSGFASVVVGSFARNLVMAFYTNEESDRELNSGSKMNVNYLDLLCDQRCRELIGDWIQTFVSTAIAVYLDKTMNMNSYDQFFSAVTNPKHEKQVTDMLVSVCNASIETLVKTSHHALTCSSSDSKLGFDSKSDLVSKTVYPTVINNARSLIAVSHKKYERGVFLDIRDGGRKSSKEIEQSDWISTVSSTLAVPSNRKFVLDVTGRVTFETVRSLLEFLLEKVYLRAKGSVRVVNEVIVESGLEILRYVIAKASAVATVCLSLCLYVLGENQALMYA